MRGSSTRRFPENLGASQSHSRSRTRGLLLLPSPHSRERAVPRPHRAPRALRTQFLPQPGFLLYRMQHAQGRSSGPRFSAHALPPGPPDPRRTRRTPPRLERSCRRQAPPCAVVADLFTRPSLFFPCMVVAPPPSRLPRARTHPPHPSFFLSLAHPATITP